MKTIKTIIPLLFLLMLASCGTDAAFVKAARDFHDSVGKDYVKYVRADVSLPEQDKATLERTVTAFDLAIKAREGK